MVPTSEEINDDVIFLEFGYLQLFSGRFFPNFREFISAWQEA